jgi:hypothetical protein
MRKLARMPSVRPPPSSKPLPQKLQLKGDVTLLTLGLPKALAPLLAGVATTTSVPKQVDAVMLFAHDAAELDAQMAKVDGRLGDDPLVWVCYPKGGSGVESDLNRDRLWELLAPRALKPVAQVAVDAVWSALRFRPAR